MAIIDGCSVLCAWCVCLGFVCAMCCLTSYTEKMRERVGRGQRAKCLESEHYSEGIRKGRVHLALRIKHLQLLLLP